MIFIYTIQPERKTLCRTLVGGRDRERMGLIILLPRCEPTAGVWLYWQRKFSLASSWEKAHIQQSLFKRLRIANKGRESERVSFVWVLFPCFPPSPWKVNRTEALIHIAVVQDPSLRQHVLFNTPRVSFNRMNPNLSRSVSKEEILVKLLWELNLRIEVTMSRRKVEIKRKFCPQVSSR